mmetsp:Transcript_34833/g.68574  ORF Transcript_34833/g.68574 Transcript_34833/m.68574 type:complete len:318 (-) Transcript_34833:273-1226(-)
MEKLSLGESVAGMPSHHSVPERMAQIIRDFMHYGWLQSQPYVASPELPHPDPPPPSVPPVCGTWKVFDLGCGTGTCGVTFAPFAYLYRNNEFEILKADLRQAEVNVSKLRESNVELRNAMLEECVSKEDRDLYEEVIRENKKVLGVKEKLLRGMETRWSELGAAAFIVPGAPTDADRNDRGFIKGCDVSQKMVKCAISCGYYSRAVNAETSDFLSDMKVELIGAGEAGVDLVLSADTLIHVGEDILFSVSGVLREGGLFVFAVDSKQYTYDEKYLRRLARENFFDVKVVSEDFVIMGEKDCSGDMKKRIYLLQKTSL